jgi:hypothetical protein
VTLYRDPVTDVAPVGVIQFRPQSSPPAAPTTGATLFVDEANRNALSVIRANESCVNVLVSCWRGEVAEGEVSTNSTSYTTAVTLSASVEVQGDYELLIYCEIAGSDTATRVWLEADIDDIDVVAEVNFGFSATYGDDGWRPFMAMCFKQDIPVADHVLTLRYKVNNGAKTGYLRRARARCVRVN